MKFNVGQNLMSKIIDVPSSWLEVQKPYPNLSLLWPQNKFQKNEISTCLRTSLEASRVLI
jgi:hypothetical protein